MQDLDPSDICKKKFLNPLKRIRVDPDHPDTDPRTDGRTDRQTDRRTDEQGESSIPPLNFVAGGIIKTCPHHFHDTSILERPKSNTTKYWLKSLRNYGAKTWNLLPNNCKSVVSLGDFKNIIKSWNGPSCKCPVCRFFLKISLALFKLLYFLFSLKCDTGLVDDMHKAILCVCTTL